MALLAARLLPSNIADVTSIARIADLISLPHFSSTSQIYAQIARHEILGGPPTTLGYLYGM